MVAIIIQSFTMLTTVYLKSISNSVLHPPLMNLFQDKLTRRDKRDLIFQQIKLAGRTNAITVMFLRIMIIMEQQKLTSFLRLRLHL